MASILDYIDWRGDLSFSVSPFNEVDAIILAQVSYLNLSGIVESSFKESKTFRQVAVEFANSEDYQKRADNGPLINQSTVELLQKLGECERFSQTKVCGYSNSVDLSNEKQFAAMSIILNDGTYFVAFRGTDQTIVGWKEDFNMAFLTPVPAQLEAVKYLENAEKDLKGKIRIGGHSKGGNLALFSSAFCNKKTQSKIIDVFNFDSPGFTEKTLQDKCFNSVIDKFHSFIPKSSIVGMLFDHEEGFTIVDSNEIGLMQHDPFSWFVLGSSFVTVDELSQDSIFIDKTVKNWLHQMDDKKREMFVDTLFGVLESSDSLTLSDLSKNWTKKTASIIKYLSKIDPETRNAVLQTIKLLFDSAKDNIPNVMNLFIK